MLNLPGVELHEYPFQINDSSTLKYINASVSAYHEHLRGDHSKARSGVVVQANDKKTRAFCYALRAQQACPNMNLIPGAHPTPFERFRAAGSFRKNQLLHYLQDSSPAAEHEPSRTAIEHLREEGRAITTHVDIGESSATAENRKRLGEEQYPIAAKKRKQVDEEQGMSYRR